MCNTRILRLALWQGRATPLYTTTLLLNVLTARGFENLVRHDIKSLGVRAYRVYTYSRKPHTVTAARHTLVLARRISSCSFFFLQSHARTLVSSPLFSITFFSTLQRRPPPAAHPLLHPRALNFKNLIWLHHPRIQLLLQQLFRSSTKTLGKLTL